MAKQDIAKNIIEASGGIARTANFLAAGLSKTDVCALFNHGYLKRVRHGYYRLAEALEISEEQLLVTLIPEGVLCVESALFYYGYSDFMPRAWSIAVPRTVSRTKIKTTAVKVKVYFIQNEHHALGKTTALLNDVELFIYDRERTLCDCFKYRSRLDNETFIKAVHAYAADEKKNLKNLSCYAKELGVYRKLSELMEVLLNTKI